jgi:hypothetical protein
MCCNGNCLKSTWAKIEEKSTQLYCFVWCECEAGAHELFDLSEISTIFKYSLIHALQRELQINP